MARRSADTAGTVRDDEKLNDVQYLRDLAERVFRIPVKYGTDQYDTDRLCRIARKLEGCT